MTRKLASTGKEDMLAATATHPKVALHRRGSMPKNRESFAQARIDQHLLASNFHPPLTGSLGESTLPQTRNPLAPPADRVPGLMKDLLGWLKRTDAQGLLHRAGQYR